MNDNKQRRTKELIDLAECRDKPVKRLLYEFASHFWIVDDYSDFDTLFEIFMRKLRDSVEEPMVLKQTTIFDPC